ncbi:pentapeptide repeat-containing protein [Kutzneria sp. NPDC051319]|uniref:pentapeptide repeat-containing protein n=1 Tax=Kutzneria sp. NPDC051319 TaxID=3155047 RepID=UPI00342CBD5A
MSSGRQAAEDRPATKVLFDEDAPDVAVSMDPTVRAAPLRWQDRLLWAWPALIICAMAMASRWGSAGVLAAGIGGTMTVVALTGLGGDDRKPTIVFLTAASVVLVGVVALTMPTTSPGQLRAGEDLNGANLSKAMLDGVSAPGVSLVHAILDNAHLAGAKLSGADLSAAHLSGADLRGADLSGANLRAATLTGACLLGVNLSGATLDGATFAGANVIKVTVTGDEMQHARDWPASAPPGNVCP